MRSFCKFLMLPMLLAIGGCKQETEEKSDSTEKFHLPQLRGNGTSWVDPAGKPIALQGVNLGSWFLWEPWMFGWFDMRDQHTMRTRIADRFGAEALAEIEELHRRTWITNEDFKRIREWGFNVVRLPFHYSLIEDPARPGQLDAKGLDWLTNAVRMAGENGLYTILDFHGAPGGQSTDAPTGRIDQNLLWDDEDYQQRFISLWRELAIHFRNNPHIACLDILNEPFGAGSEQAFEEELVELFGKVYQAIRETGNDSLLLAPGTLRGFYFWPSPEERGWEQVGFTEHFYPGVFGGEATLKGHADFFSNKLAGRLRLLEKWQAPYLVGEFNPIFQRVGGDKMLVEHFRRYAEWGWAATMWTYKMITPEGGIPKDNWPLWTNENPITPPKLSTASLDELRDFFSGKGVTNWVADEAFLAIFQDEDAVRLDLDGKKPIVQPAATDAPPEGWQMASLGFGTLPPALIRKNDGSSEFFATGFDINHGDDGNGFLFEEVAGDFDVRVSLDEFEADQRWAKAGLMVRESTQPGSRMLLWNIFPSGDSAVMARTEQKTKPTETLYPDIGNPVWLRMTRQGDQFSLFHSADGQKWVQVARVRLSGFSAPLLAGLAVSSNEGHLPARLKFSSLTLSPPAP